MYDDKRVHIFLGKCDCLMTGIRNLDILKSKQIGKIYIKKIVGDIYCFHSCLVFRVYPNGSKGVNKEEVLTGT